MLLKEQLRADLKEAMVAGDKERRDVLRLLLAAIKQEEVDEGLVLDEAGVENVLARQAKQRRESIADSERAGRPDLAAQELAELRIIETYLPEMMSRAEIEAVARVVISETGASSMKDMGMVMGRLMPQVKGKADGREVNEVVRNLLQS